MSDALTPLGALTSVDLASALGALTRACGACSTDVLLWQADILSIDPVLWPAMLSDLQAAMDRLQAAVKEAERIKATYRRALIDEALSVRVWADPAKN